ncbi:DUF7342 family protein [Salinarchaeum laminariae]|uniref:DUF7342 family protein n=1 Tax=Salinarchaeum laminariae TaxID=869888 RepID=UPI0020C06990|nr:hypothetical protein [Salinarchaeum laminariae]
MDEPRAELKADLNERSNAPDFDELAPAEDIVHGDRTRDDFFDAVLGLDSPATATEVADRAGHGVDAAREYLEWFDQLGIVTQVTESPASYERNQEYLDWRRVQNLREEYDSEELLDMLSEASDRETDLASEFTVSSPDRVSVAQHAEKTDQSIDEVWERLSAWRTAARRVTLLERALIP